jgi:hypothetical protein
MPEIFIEIAALKELKDAQRLIRRCKAEMQKNGTWGNGSTPKPYTRTMLLTIDGEPVSVLCFAPIGITNAKKSKVEGIMEIAGVILIMGAYTVRKWRGKGCYRILWKHLLKTYQNDPDYVVVRSGAHKKNTASIAMQHKQGRDIFEQGKTHVRSRYWLRPTHRQKLCRKLNWLRYKTVGLPFVEKTAYSKD